MPSTLEEHKTWTRQEWGGETIYDYYPKILNYLKDKNIKVSLDAGGCTGEITNIFIENFPSLEKAIVIEPIDSNYNFIVSNVKSDTVDISILKKALFYGKKTVSMESSDPNVGGYYVGNSNTNVVKTITIEDLSKNTTIDLIKMDIEGAEKNVIENSTILKEIRYIEIEFHNELHRPNEWKSFIKKYLPNHSIIFTDENILDSGSCCSHALLEKVK